MKSLQSVISVEVLQIHTPTVKTKGAIFYLYNVKHVLQNMKVLAVMLALISLNSLKINRKN